ncbi:MAG: glycosyltransferase family 2 protein [Bryobacteraceae bacterium]
MGILVVTHNSETEIGSCLDAAMRTGASVLVVDNASSDKTLEVVRSRNARCIANAANLGFAAAVNRGIRELATEYVLLLNPDAVIATGIEALREACGRENVAAAGGMLVDGQSNPQVGFQVRRFPTPAALAFEALLLNRLWPRNPVNWNYRCIGHIVSEPGEVEQPAGAFLMIRRAVWDRLGGFDEQFYPVWFEEVDFCKRANALGYKIRYEPAAVAKHTGAHSVGKISLEYRQLYWYGNFLRYAAKHFRTGPLRMVSLAVILGSLSRTLIELSTGSLKPIAVCGKVLRLAAVYLIFGGRAGR